MKSREYPERPIVGVGGIAIAETGDRVLLVRRAHEPLAGEWSIPGGALEVGELLTECAARELLEETGIAVEVLEMVEVFDRVLRAPDGRVQYHFVLIDYLCRPRDAGAVPRPGSDSSEARWVARGDVPQYGLRPETLAVIEKAFRMHRAREAS